MKTSLLAMPAVVLLLSLGSCTAKYQDLLRDRDAQIRELNGDLSELRANNVDLERRAQSARDELDQLRKGGLAKPDAATGDLARVQEDLAGLDVRYSHGRLTIGIENTVTFTSGSVELKQSANSVLRKVADVLKRDFSGRRIFIEGHTDTDPIVKTKGRFRSNRHLSAERADVVADFLVRQGGIDPAQVVVVGYGQYDPRDAGAADSSKAKNRRVEIVVGEPM